MTKKQLRQILDLHGAWLKGKPGGQKADLSEADLRGANLRGADLRGANLRETDLREADLYGADLRGANLSEAYLHGSALRGANLSGANLYGTNLRGADLFRANLSEAYLRGADLYGADLRGAYLRGADLHEADLREADLPNFQLVPEIGSFLAYKKLCQGYIAILEIPEKAKRTSSLVGRKCRAEYVKVLSIETADGKRIKEGASHRANTIYKVGRRVKPDKYDPDIRVECTNGIHFFITKEEAKQYDFT